MCALYSLWSIECLFEPKYCPKINISAISIIYKQEVMTNILYYYIEYYSKDNT